VAELKPEVITRLRAARALLFDMDGTLVLGDRRNDVLRPLPGAKEITTYLTQRGIRFAVFTNGTTRSPAAYAATLREAGLRLTDAQVFTPASSAVDVCLRRGHTRVMVLGGDGLARPLRDAGIEAVPATRHTKVDAVLVGWFREVTFDHLEAACEAVWTGARLYSASQSLYFATAEGKVIGTSRAISVMIHDLTGQRIEIVGKPSLFALRAVADRLRVRTSELAVIGDDPELEVPMAHRGGALAIAVNTGIGHADSFNRMDNGKRPHLILNGVDALLDLVRELDIGSEAK
jgi:NagD protein